MALAMAGARFLYTAHSKDGRDSGNAWTLKHRVIIYAAYHVLNAEHLPNVEHLTLPVIPKSTSTHRVLWTWQFFGE